MAVNRDTPDRPAAALHWPQLVKQPRKLVKLGNAVNEAWKTRFLAEGLDHARRLPRMKV